MIRIFHRGKKTKAQSILEYTLLICIIVAAFFGSQTYIRRALSGYWRNMADTFGFGKQFCEGDQCPPVTPTTHKACSGAGPGSCVTINLPPGPGDVQCATDTDCCFAQGHLCVYAGQCCSGLTCQLIPGNPEETCEFCFPTGVFCIDDSQCCPGLTCLFNQGLHFCG